MSPDAAAVPARPGAKRLLVPLAPDVRARLDAYPDMLRKALPLRPGLVRELPKVVRELSLSLTAEREGGPRPGYLSDPKVLSAYLWYYLPWNLVRLTRLLPGLDLDIPDDGVVCDLGSGPLTFIQALWLSRPDLRKRRLRITCVDRSKRALELGLALFAELAGFDPTRPDAPWRIRVTRGEYWQGLTDGADLVAMVNVANELAGKVREPLDERMERVAAQLSESLVPGGRVLVVEPGTRLGWRCLLGMRQAFVEMDMDIAAPCPHREECVLLAGRTRAWCHFTMPPAGAPRWLTAFSERAGLGKERLSLSFLLARKVRPAPSGGARVVSGAFSLADVPGSAVYGCSASGLLVLCSPDRRPPAPGDLLAVDVPAGAPLDAKSGAPRVMLAPDPSGQRPAEPGGAPGRDLGRADKAARGQDRRSGPPQAGAGSREDKGGKRRPRSGGAPGATRQAPVKKPSRPATKGQSSGSGKPARPLRSRRD
ncbi:small ribosomal subunit Rsm22 family protein [Solidesulfovibrio carbinolicus]|uniref:Ribosomal methyltransferase n=1 Tax=Solidesulfovibrio carbinolicus TaxID=296842 RepID=A0A4P6HJ50_9BACT|nr:small ribosomal subunit Rsm22 family protein [Solidesulfovibrio carbinolicus]QAZ67213.1 ribosomal methyltransferase [Solidesulfovibrio carbinolicus]